jgi:BirA family biotin operon repressor/biotin-[acetyl-CoA-carboxylase] ligase
VSLHEDELPVPTATSLLVAGATALDRDPLLRAVLRETERWYGAWLAAGGDAERCGLRAAYVERCVTVGSTVRVELPAGRQLSGEATGVDAAGALLVAPSPGAEPVAVTAGDVVHVRPTGAAG